MKWIKKINELYDDNSHSIPKSEIKNIMSRKIWDKIHKGTSDKIVDIPYDIKDEFGKDVDSFSHLYVFENKLKKEISNLKYFNLVEREEKKSFFNLKYELLKNVKDVAEFSLELKIMGDIKSDEYTFIFTPFIKRTEFVDLNNPSYRVMNSEIVDNVESYIEAIKKMYPKFSDKQVFMKMEEYISDFKNGSIVSYEDSDFIKPLGLYLTTKKSYNKRSNETEYENIISKINDNIKIYDNYTKTMFNVSLFEK
jgi:hypothetical protein